MSDKINKKPSKISGYYFNNSRKNFDFTMNRIYDLLERDTYYKEQVQYVAKIVSGINTGDNTAPQSDSFFGLLNGVQQRSYKIRFIEQDEKFNKDEDPTVPGLSQRQIDELVSAHPDAFYEASEAMPQAPSFNSIVLVSREGLTYKIIKTLGIAGGFGGSASLLTGRGAFDTNSPSFLSRLSTLQSNPEKLKEREISAPDSMISLIYASFNQAQPEYKLESVYFFGVRNLGKSDYNIFSDTLIAAVWKGTKFKFYSFIITTTPGTQFLGDLAYNKDGTLVLASPQYIKDAYKFHKHQGKYLALGQSNTFYYWRDTNRDKKPDDSPADKVTLHKGKDNGVNIHRASPTNKTKNISGAKGRTPATAYKYENGKWTQIITNAYTYSAGCQVFSDPVDFNNFLDLVAKDKLQNSKNLWDYFLIDSEDFATLKSGRTIKPSITKKQKEKGLN